MGAGYDPCPLCGDEDDFYIIQKFGKCRDCVHQELAALLARLNRQEAEIAKLNAVIRLHRRVRRKT